MIKNRKEKIGLKILNNENNKKFKKYNIKEKKLGENQYAISLVTNLY